MKKAKVIVELGRPVLRKIAKTIKDPQSSQTQTLFEDLYRTLQTQDGVGLAAPQIGVSKRAFIIQEDKEEDPFFIINPIVTKISDTTEALWEGCLSIPGIRGLVSRPTDILVEFQNLSGETFQAELVDFTARIFLHELDHLNGIVFLDHCSSREIITDKEYMKQLKKMTKRQKTEGPVQDDD